MRRCLELAQLGNGNVAPNPMVGAVLVYEDLIIGEGYHQKYGEAHAEVNCIQSLKPEHQHLIEQSVLYVSLEPCAHFGKTPPCADLIVQKKIPKVVIGCRDPFVQVDGKGIERLKAAGVEVELGVLEDKCQELNKRFFTFHIRHRPYIILKWAQSTDGKIGAHPLLKQDAALGKGIETSRVSARLSSPIGGSRMGARVLISNEYTNRIVHKWRSEEMAIVVGTNTAVFDDPELSTRLWPGKNPVRVVTDMDLRLPKSLKLFDGKTPTLIFNSKQHALDDEWLKSPFLTKKAGAGFYQVTEDVSLVHQMLNALYSMKIQSILVEGGARLLQSFIDEGAWDEARVITNKELLLGNGLPAPVLKDHKLVYSENIFSDTLQTYQPINQSTY
jgi:diaminohydroxyphosphoribosylaminopyrimidine deaminase/5-amino-6-(5-phosphoribosylamino)uracil reductase